MSGDLLNRPCRRTSHGQMRAERVPQSMRSTGRNTWASIGQRLQASRDQTRVLIGAGTAAGFAAAYNTPFAASLFVLEPIAGVAAPELLLPVMAATVGAQASCAQPSEPARSMVSEPSASDRTQSSCHSRCLE